MENNMFKRMLPLMVGAVVIITGVVVFTILMSGSKATPWGSISNETYYSANGYTVSEREWYDRARYSSYSYFIDMIDAELIDVEKLIADAEAIEYDDKYDSEVTNLYKKFHQDVVYNYMYGTTDRATIDRMSSYEKTLAASSYYDELSLVGVNTNDYWSDAVLARYEIAVAKLMYAYNYYQDYYNDEDNEDEYATDAVLLEYWEENIQYEGTVNAIVVTFSSQSEYDTAFSSIGVCKASSGYYIGASQTNCLDGTKLTNAEVLDRFVTIYNNMNYNYNGQTATTAGIEFSNYALDQIDSDISTMVFETLGSGVDAEDLPYTIAETVDSNGDYYIAFKVSGVVPEIAEDDYDAIFDRMALDAVTITSATAVIEELRSDAKIVIYDPVLESLYKYSYTDFKTSKKESDDYIASVNGNNISVDDFYAYIEESIAVDVSVELIAIQIAEGSVADSVSSDDKSDIKSSIKEDVDYFKRGGYDSYGFDSGSYGESVFLAVMYQATSIDDAIAKQTKQTYVNNYFLDYEVVYGDSFYEDVLHYINEQYADYFKFNATEFVIYVDADRDGVADNFLDAGMSTTQTAAFANALMSAIYDAQGTTPSGSDRLTYATAITYVISDYNSINMMTGSSHSLYQYYEAGFRVSAGSSTLYDSTSSYSSSSGVLSLAYDAEVYQGLIDMYNYYSESVWAGFDEDSAESSTGNNSYTAGVNTIGNITGPGTAATATYNDLIITEAGVHLYLVESGYEKPEFHADGDLNLTVEDVEYVLTTDADDLTCDAEDDEGVNECIDEDEYDLILEFYNNISVRLTSSYQKYLSLFMNLEDSSYVNSSLDNHLQNRIAVYQRKLDGYEEFSTSIDGPFYEWFDKFSPTV